MAEREEKKKKEKKRKEEGVGSVTRRCLWYHRRTSISFILKGKIFGVRIEMKIKININKII